MLDGEIQLVVPPREMQQNYLTQIVGTAKVDVAMAIFDMQILNNTTYSVYVQGLRGSSQRGPAPKRCEKRPPASRAILV
jgi:hypothetical protein